MNFEKITQDATKTIKQFQVNNPNWVVIIRWATATGKTRLSVELAKEINLEVISCDSRQFFRKMNIWTDKISEEIRNKLPHHLIDNIDPDQKFTAGQRKEEAKKKIINILFQRQPPTMVLEQN